MGAYGKTVVIQHHGGYKTLYAHNSRIYVRRGQKVKRGAVISKSGNTGYSFGPHVHFEISRYGRHLNPAKYFKGLRYKKRKRRRR
jgi:murein DD-endopeptidase MepM/ murein hydrolase activator NlpD